MLFCSHKLDLKYIYCIPQNERVPGVGKDEVYKVRRYILHTQEL